MYDFLELRKNHGKEEMRARDLFYALWIPDLFMTRVMENGDWTLFCPDETTELLADGTRTKSLQDAYGEEFEGLYLKLEKAGKGKKTVKAQHLWGKICESQMETGTPYMCYKDAANKKSNQKNLGTGKEVDHVHVDIIHAAVHMVVHVDMVIESSIHRCRRLWNAYVGYVPCMDSRTVLEFRPPGTIRCSNLCTEVFQYTSPDEVAVCNLASIALPMFVEDGVYNFQKLKDITKVITRNLNRVIDRNYYPIEQAKLSNMKHRPIGIGVQGLADT